MSNQIAMKITAKEIHHKGSNARILLSSVFGPYAQDDEFGSRTINPMELYHNQVTRAQGSFSLRMFHRSWGIMMIQENISAPCSVLDFPTREAFARELTANHYDIVGISSIIVNVGKVREMCRMVRELSPDSTIVVGGHVTAIPGIEEMIDADHIVRGEGISWMRRYLGEDEHAPIRHPAIVSGLETRIMGIRLPNGKAERQRLLFLRWDAPWGATSAPRPLFLAAKGSFSTFTRLGDELFEVMCRIESELEVHSFFVMDENFLLHRTRAMRLLELMKETGKSWELSVSHPPTRFENTPCWNWSNSEFPGCGWGWNLLGLAIASCKVTMCGNLRASCANMAYGCRGQPSSGWSTTRPRISSRKSNRRWLTRPTFTSSCSTRRFRARRFIRKWRSRGAC